MGLNPNVIFPQDSQMGVPKLGCCSKTLNIHIFLKSSQFENMKALSYVLQKGLSKGV
jgi:hypothetical protein